MARRKIKKIAFLFLGIALLLFGVYFLSFSNENYAETKNVGFVARVFFLPEDENQFVSFFEKHEWECVFFNASYAELLKRLSVLIVDDSAYKKYKKLYSDLNIIVYHDDDPYSYVHTKMCVFDENLLLIGSGNLTYDGIKRENNNFVVLYSKDITKEAKKELDEMKKGYFGKNSLKNTKNDFGKIKLFFCPEDDCEKVYLEVLNEAREKIHCMFYDLTLKSVIEKLDEKGKNKDVKIIFEKNQTKRNKNYSGFWKIESAKKCLDKNKKNMHNKFCVIDEKIVITGSMNPSKHSKNDNDEALLVVYDKNIGKKYESYFQKYWEEWCEK